MPSRLILGALASAALLASSVGCQTLRGDRPKLAEKIDIPNGVPWLGDKEPKPGTPARIVATWKDAVLQRPGVAAQRGIGGRLFFYNGKDTTPIPVEGQLVVYAFDETDRAPSDNKPTRRFVFPPEQFTRHQSDSEFGPSYSVWLPWDDAPGARTEISLIARFEPMKGGALVASDQSTAVLPGDLRLESITGTRIAKSKQATDILQASHNSAAAEEPTPRKRTMETTSIKLPSRSISAGR